MFEENKKPAGKKPLRKITKQRLKNIALYYLKRFDSSVDNLRQVLKRRTNDFAYQNPDFDKFSAYEWIEELLKEFEGYGYLNDERYAEIKIRGYLSAGKPERYILGKMREKGIDENVVEKLLGEQEYDLYEMAMRIAKKKKIGPYRIEEERKDFWQKDMMKLVQAGFDYEVAKQVMETEGE
ncbi:MAG: recombination regulator RecX [Lactobacillus sp.]|nr:recombination regulator RecX [Lactobacillus sp.]